MKKSKHSLGLGHFHDRTREHIVDPSHAEIGVHLLPSQLYVVTCLENPLRWRSRYANYHHFAKHVEDAGATLITVESAFGNREFEVTEPGNPWHVQVRVHDELFRKENLQNIGAQRLPLDAKYVAFIDADVIFTRPDWVQETLHLLQHYAVIQMFSDFCDVGPRHKILGCSPSFMYNFLNEKEDFCGGFYDDGRKKTNKWSGAPGLAWAYRVRALDLLGGLLDRCILGGGDSHMAFGLVGREDLGKFHLEYVNGSTAYRAYTTNWQQNAARLKKNIGMMEGTLLHKWHGPKALRGYATRPKILKKYHYDPFMDILEDHQGIIFLKGNKIGLRDEIRAYFRRRDEDSKEHTPCGSTKKK